MVKIKTTKITPTVKMDYETYMEIQKAGMSGKMFIIKGMDAVIDIKNKDITITLELELEW